MASAIIARYSKWHITLFCARISLSCRTYKWTQHSIDGVRCLCPFAGLLTLGIEIEIYLFVRPLFDAVLCAYETNWNVLLKLFQKPHKTPLLRSDLLCSFLWSGIFFRSILFFSHLAWERPSLHAFMYTCYCIHTYIQHDEIPFFRPKLFCLLVFSPQLTTLLHFFLILASQCDNIFWVHGSHAICALHKYQLQSTINVDVAINQFNEH